MEQAIVDFFAKASELILHNRIVTAKTLEAALNQMTHPNPWRFQMNFDQKFNFSAKIPSQWNSQPHKLLVLEFFLLNKITQEKFLVEQWNFELNQVADSKLKYTIDSPNTLYKKLSVLLRTMSLLTVTLPLYKNFINDKTGQLYEDFTLEHSINFTRHTLSTWHSSIYEERNLTNFTNPDLILPGRTFAFKVNYPKSLKFLQTISEESMNQNGNPLKALKEKLDINYFNPSRRDQVQSEPATNPWAKIAKQNSMDINKANTSLGQENLSPKEQTLAASEGFSENASSPIGSLLTFSPIETQRSPVKPAQVRSRTSSYGSYPAAQNNNPKANRAKFGTLHSESSGEYDMYVYDDTEGKFTEVLSSKEINIRADAPVKLSPHPRASEDEQTLGEPPRKFEITDLKLSGNAKPIEKIIEQTDDDKIAELIQVIENLKEAYIVSEQKRDDNSPSSPVVDTQNGKKSAYNMKKGLRFHHSLQGIEGLNEEMPDISTDYKNLGDLYVKLKGKS